MTDTEIQEPGLIKSVFKFLLKALLTIVLIVAIVIGAGKLVMGKILGLDTVFTNISALQGSIKLQEEQFNAMLKEKQAKIDALKEEIDDLREDITELDEDLVAMDDELRKTTNNLWYKIKTTQQKLKDAEPKDVVNEWKTTW